ncbi:MAG: hypothetical protein BJ554DRAFT_7580 [Olpidium bornovanus]|uniref:CsbD-like domain-containing protein n=1 Tax=Olpidium bornovanus TaxID=278681 RepID=A0A8H7ZVV3_9FUNG|nr:MAG: hypothetical protein BJ554DRAFT_7580 [Olpidium bornovanus]
MPDTPTKLHGQTEAAIGGAKETGGKVIGNESLQAKGANQKAAGNAETQGYKRAIEKKSFSEPFQSSPTCCVFHNREILNFARRSFRFFFSGTAAKAKEYTEGTADNVKGSVKSAFGGLTGDKSMQAEGEYDKVCARPEILICFRLSQTRPLEFS